MSNNERARWSCPNRDCNWSMVATVAEGGEAPRCVCGVRMHRVEAIPVFSYLDFLHDEVAVTEELGSKEE
jgi:hypothetical protein